MDTKEALRYSFARISSNWFCSVLKVGPFYVLKVGHRVSCLPSKNRLVRCSCFNKKVIKIAREGLRLEV